MTVSVLGRHLFLQPVPDDLRMVGLLTVGVIVLPLAFVERHRGHITVTVTTNWMSPRALGVLRAAGALAMGLFFGAIGFMVAMRLPQEIAQGSYYDGVLRIPTWPMKLVFAFGITLFVIRLCFSFIDGLRTAATGIAPEPPNRDREEI